MKSNLVENKKTHRPMEKVKDPNIITHNYSLYYSTKMPNIC